MFDNEKMINFIQLYMAERDMNTLNELLPKFDELFERMLNANLVVEAWKEPLQRALQSKINMSLH